MFFSKPAGLLTRSHQKSRQESKVIAISSPHGSTGKTTVAINLALELANERAQVLLIDADLKAGSIANHFMLQELPAGLSGALRIASQNRLDLQQIERLSVLLPKTSLRILPAGHLATAQAFDKQSLINLIETAKSHFDYTVVDLTSLGIDDADSESLIERNQGFTESLFQLADQQLVVCLADPIGIFRLLAQEKQILNLAGSPLVIMNRVRNQVIPQAKTEISITLQRLSELAVCAYLPDDPQQIDQALKTGVPAVSLSRSGAFRQGITGFARAEILGTKGKLDSRVAKLG